MTPNSCGDAEVGLVACGLGALFVLACTPAPILPPPPAPRPPEAIQALPLPAERPTQGPLVPSSQAPSHSPQPVAPLASAPPKLVPAISPAGGGMAGPPAQPSSKPASLFPVPQAAGVLLQGELSFAGEGWSLQLGLPQAR